MSREAVRPNAACEVQGEGSGAEDSQGWLTTHISRTELQHLHSCAALLVAPGGRNRGLEQQRKPATIPSAFIIQQLFPEHLLCARGVRVSYHARDKTVTETFSSC